MVHDSLRPHVEKLYRLADRNVFVPPGMGPLAVGLLGEEAFDVPTGPMLRGTLAQLIKWQGCWRIRIVESAPRAELSYSVALALARWYRDRFASDPRFPLEEFATRVLLPIQAVYLCGELGYGSDDLARMFLVPERIAAIRMREVFAPASSGSFSRIELAG